jgi:hypothetical protein
MPFDVQRYYFPYQRPCADREYANTGAMGQPTGWASLRLQEA